MSENSAVQIGHTVFVFPRLPFEIDKVYFERRNYFKKLSPKTDIEYLKAIQKSMIWANVKFLKCVYPKEVMDGL